MKLPTLLAIAVVQMMTTQVCFAGTNFFDSTVWSPPSPAGPGYNHPQPIQQETASGYDSAPHCQSVECLPGDGFACNSAACTARSWFASGGGLVMTRAQDDDILFGYDDGDASYRLTFRDSAMDYSGGFEAHLGRYFGDCWACEAVYWGIRPSDQYSHLYASNAAGNLMSPVQFGFLEYDNGTGAAAADTYFDNSQVLRIVRTFEYHNVELNFWRNASPNSCGRCSYAFLAGARYMQLSELFDLDTDVANNAFGDDIANELFYDISVDNYLVGFQIGGRLDYCVTERLSFEFGSKAGVFGNHINHRQSLWGGNGSALIAAGSPLGYAGSAYSSDSSKDDVAFLAELMPGISCQLTSRWRIGVGYRVVALSGVAVPSGQIPHRFDNLAAVNNVNSTDTLVLHGATASLEFNW